MNFARNVFAGLFVSVCPVVRFAPAMVLPSMLSSGWPLIGWYCRNRHAGFRPLRLRSELVVGKPGGQGSMQMYFAWSFFAGPIGGSLDLKQAPVSC